MSLITIRNEALTITISTHGAELQSVLEADGNSPATLAEAGIAEAGVRYRPVGST